MIQMTEYERGFIDGVKSKVEAELTPTIIKMTDGLSQTIQEAVKNVMANVKITAHEPEKEGYWEEMSVYDNNLKDNLYDEITWFLNEFKDEDSIVTLLEIVTRAINEKLNY